MPLKGHLHYGGTIKQSNSKLSHKPRDGGFFKTQKRFETIIRLENAGFMDSTIAAMICISVPKLQHIKKEPAYLAARIQLTHGIILDNESKVAAIKEQRKEILTQMLPPALQILANELQHPAVTISERKHKTAVALEVLDREGTFAKVSRTEIKPVDSFDFEKADAASAEIIAALKGTSSVAGRQLGHNTIEAIVANEEFSNSHTLSAVDQQAALDALDQSEGQPEISTEALELMAVDEKVN